MTADRVSQHYAGDAGEKYFAWQRGIGRLGGRLNLFKFAPFVSEASVVLDFGCGGGFLLEQLTAREKVGVEVSAPARRDAEARGLRVVASAEELPNDAFDVVVSNHALEHCRRPLDELELLRTKLKVGGVAVFCLPVDDWRTERTYRADDINRHLYTWSPLLAGNLFSDAGYTVRSVRLLRHAWSPKVWRMFGWNAVLYRLACLLVAVVRRRYQVLVVAERPA